MAQKEILKMLIFNTNFTNGTNVTNKCREKTKVKKEVIFAIRQFVSFVMNPLTFFGVLA